MKITSRVTTLVTSLSPYVWTHTTGKAIEVLKYLLVPNIRKYTIGRSER